jgi:predicted acyltransferase
MKYQLLQQDSNNSDSEAKMNVEPIKDKDQSKPSRLQSIDTFRGFCLMIMIFVNYGGGGYWFFDHATWNGITFADLLFPCFMWVMGCSMALSFSSLQKSPCGDELNWWKRIIRRSVILFGLGLFLANGYRVTSDSHYWRICGVLQYFSISYFLVSSTILVMRSLTYKSIREIIQQEELASLSSKESSRTTLLPQDFRNTSIFFRTNKLDRNDHNSQPRSTVHNDKSTIVFDSSYNYSHNNDLSSYDDSSSFNRSSEDVLFQNEVYRDRNDQASLSGTTLPAVHSDKSSYFFRREDSTHTLPTSSYIAWNILSTLETNITLFRQQFNRSSIMWAYRYEWILQLSVLGIYLIIALAVPAPNCPGGYNGPGGISNDSNYPECTGGIHKYIDVSIFGISRLYHHPTCLYVYDCTPYDPEGVLGSLTATLLTYLGLMSGRVVIHFSSHQDRIIRWLICGFILLLLAGILCGFSRDDGVIPLNKNLWSFSFILLTAGGGLLCLSFTYAMVDIYKVWSGAPFRYLGLNSIFIYCGHSILQGYFPFSYSLDDRETHESLLTMNIVGVSCWILVAYYCYTIDFFVKI